MADTIIHLTTEGERWDIIAWRYYGSVNEAGRIMEANPSVPLVPVLPSGVRLSIPVINATTADETANLPPWCGGAE
ncbi:tail protein X [Bilophila wadsworthia]|uniref:tail protein X n=1 Tax=Bilophila wadsworthia TaxID=35833 RepID=UPI00242FDBEE|nr:tail protein X [Bilophila wadsworthia]